MSKAILVLAGKTERDRAIGWIAKAPVNTRVTFAEPKRTLPQNDRMWAILTDIARQRPTHQGIKMTPDLWKAVFMQAAGAEIAFLPTLEGNGMFPIGLRSSELSKAEMSALIEFMQAWAAQAGVTLGDEPEMAAAA